MQVTSEEITPFSQSLPEWLLSKIDNPIEWAWGFLFCFKQGFHTSMSKMMGNPLEERLPPKNTINWTIPGIEQQNKQELSEHLCGFEKDYARVVVFFFPENFCHFLSSYWKPADRQEYFQGSQCWREQRSKQLRTWLQTQSCFSESFCGGAFMTSYAICCLWSCRNKMCQFSHGSDWALQFCLRQGWTGDSWEGWTVLSPPCALH